MKAYTDIEQSEKLAKILSRETSDLWYSYYGNSKYNPTFAYKGEQWFLSKDMNGIRDIPCWSLAALLDVLESEIDGENGETYKLNIEKDGTWWDIWYSEEYDEENPIEITSTEELVDACYAMIIKLKERNLI